MIVPRFRPPSSLPLLLLALLGCGGKGDDGPAAKVEAPPPSPETPVPVAPPEDPPDPDVVDFEFDGELGDALIAAGAVPAWDAVIDRYRWLDRRGARGAIWGRLGAAEGGYRWFIDESQGAGSLAVRAALPPTMVLDEGARAILYGAWAVDAERRWYWKVSGAARLPPAAAVEPDPLAASAPGHVIETGEPIDGMQPVGRVDKRGGVIWFEVVRGPRRPGDGWLVADRSHFDPIAVLLLPGERDPYGGQDFLTPDERWRLDQKVRYVVRVARSRDPRKPGELRQLRAITPPRRLDAKEGN